MYDGKLIQAKHYFEMSTILLYYDFSLVLITNNSFHTLISQLSNNDKNTFCTNILQQTALSPLKKVKYYILIVLINPIIECQQFSLVAHALVWFWSNTASPSTQCVTNRY